MALAKMGDPLNVARSSGRSLPLPLETMRNAIAAEISERIQPLTSRASTTGTSLNIWYAAAQLWLDPEMEDLTVRGLGGRRTAGHVRPLVSTTCQPGCS